MQQHTAHWAVVPVVVISFILAGCGSSGSDQAATPSDLEQAKGAVTELRTWSSEIAKLDSQGSDFSGELVEVASVSGQIAANAVEALGFALQAMSNAYLSGNASPYSLASYMPTGFSGSATGSIVLTGGQFSIANGDINGNTVNVVINPPNLNGAAYKLDVVSAKVTNATTFAQIDKGMVDVTYPGSTSLSNIAAGIYTDLPDSVVFEVQATVGQNLSATVTNPVSYTGRIVFMAQRPNNGQPNPSRMLMSGEFKNNTHSFGAAFEVNMRNASTFVAMPSSMTGSDENATRWRDIDGTLTYSMKLGDLPKAQIILAFDRTAYLAITGSVTVAYANVTIKLEDGLNAGKETGLKLTLMATKDGKTTVVAIQPDTTDKTKLTGIVTVNGNKVGTIKPGMNNKALIVTYNDGTFETVTF